MLEWPEAALDLVVISMLKSLSTRYFNGLSPLLYLLDVWQFLEAVLGFTYHVSRVKF